MAAEFSVFEMQASGHYIAGSRGIFGPEKKTVRVYDADIRNPLYFSLFPQRGWLPIHEAVLISHPSRAPSKTMRLRSSISRRIVQIIIEQNHEKEQSLLEEIIRVYTPYLFAIARCPPLTLRLLDITGRRQSMEEFSPILLKKNNEAIFEEIIEEEKVGISMKLCKS